MTKAVPADKLRANELLEELTVALRHGRESVIKYAEMLITRDVYQSLLIGRTSNVGQHRKEGEGPNSYRCVSDARLLRAAINDLTVHPVQPGTSSSASRIAAGSAVRNADPASANLPDSSERRDTRVETAVDCLPETTAAASRRVTAPGSPKAREEARTYIEARLADGAGVDRRAVAILTGWEAPRVNRFVAEIQDAHLAERKAKKQAPAP